MSEPTVTLANCEDEPIHLPGAIQPHGALIALDEQGQVLGLSDNLGLLLGIAPQLGLPLAEEDVGGNVLTMLAEGLRTDGPWVNSVEARIGRRFFDVIGHSHDGVFYLEFERRASGAASFTTFALNAQRLVSQLQLRNDVESLLVSVTDEVRRMTGYDRVMAYRFNEDDSGEVVAEARREDLESYLGQRYPASDIPAQARRLYLQNPVRLIGDAAYQPVNVQPTLNPRSGRPFDLSFSTLRSVSPIHCEYLANMGVRASMSISIVVGGRLWGLFSCHHMSPKLVPYPIRMSFQVFSQVCSAMVERLEQSRTSELLRQASERQQALLRCTRDSDDLLSALTRPGASVADLLPCDGAVVMLGGRTSSIGGDFEALAVSIVAQLQQDDELDLFHSDRRLEPAAEQYDPRYCGALAIRFHRQESGWIVWLRQEQVHRIRWGGKPEKILKTGPSGSRLTPRGSFEAWEEVVQGRSTPWTGIDLSIAEKLRTELVELCLNRAGEIDRMRQRLIAVLGHDLRNPLQSISMAAAMLSSSDVRNAELRQHITYSSSRMERLISQILEMSRLQSGGGMTVKPVAADLSRLVRDIVQETDVAYPGLSIETAIEDGVQGAVDPDRYLQVAANLLSNARHHGRPGRPVLVELRREEDWARLSILNEAEALDEARLANLFVPFKQDVPGHGRNKSGLGIGLYISQAIVGAHGGHIEVEQADGIITFSVLVPLNPST
ncbi:light-regulated signal transduction histidine kinase (bacteriophytochrome) [Pseudomonas nitritireducens]|uniref:histidine kinase n=1 Tax=Pseudomonas nitroreducens TaxID=46680 RepID=A0A7W7P4C8_PSENT|nr:GAF domain-containing protein [Pseudomonas nitritireducens]MBB4867938.1 light-regulated signal transduction histidine kinase (bacteriophytochrome) [Pseudomonas nitritireducens]